MKKCKCGQYNDDEAKFCQRCGSDISAKISDFGLNLGDANAISAQEIESGGKHVINAETYVVNNPIQNSKQETKESVLKIIPDKVCDIYKDMEIMANNAPDGIVTRIPLGALGEFILNFRTTQISIEYTFNVIQLGVEECLFVNFEYGLVETIKERNIRQQQEYNKRQEQKRIVEQEAQAEIECKKEEVRIEAEEKVKQEQLAKDIKKDQLPFGVYAKDIHKEYYSRIGSPAHFEIPHGYTSIGKDAFEYSDITSVVIPTSVRTIGDGAFFFCENLKAIDIPPSVNVIKNAAFVNCSSLKTVIIPKSVERIGDEAFAQCSSLQSIYIPSSVKNIGEAFVANCPKLESIEIAGDNFYFKEGVFIGRQHILASIPKKVQGYFVVWQSIRHIGKHAFAGCSNLTSIKTPKALKSIGDYAFAECSNLESIIVTDSIIEIGEGAFNRCDKLTIHISQKHKLYARLKAEYKDHIKITEGTSSTSTPIINTAKTKSTCTLTLHRSKQTQYLWSPGIDVSVDGGKFYKASNGNSESQLLLKGNHKIVFKSNIFRKTTLIINIHNDTYLNFFLGDSGKIEASWDPKMLTVLEFTKK